MLDNPIAGKPLHYLIGSDAPGDGHDGVITEVAYDIERPVKRGVSVAYCNLFDEKFGETKHPEYGPYLEQDGTAEAYNEGKIDPTKKGWAKNLRAQFERRRKQGFEYVELDNPDAYALKHVLGAVDLAASYGFNVIAKNPGLLDANASAFVAHKSIVGAIVEKDAKATPAALDAIRRKAGKPNLPVWFVAFGDGKEWAKKTAAAAKRYPGMFVTYSTEGEYKNATPV